MTFDDRIRMKALRGLPTLPRVLFELYAFDNIDPAEMAREFGIDIASIMLCLAEARDMIAARRLHQPPCRFDPATVGGPIAQLEHNMRQQYRQWLEVTMIASGYFAPIQWPDLSADEGAEQEAVAALILSGLPVKMHRAVERSRMATGVAAMGRCYTPPWRTIMRRQLDRLGREVRYSGWQSFDVWLADRIAPDHHYPDGLPISRLVRRPLPEEPRVTDQPEGGERSSALTAMQARFDRLPALTQEVFFLHDRYGRTVDEITERLGIGQRSVKRRIRVALSVILRGSPPSFWYTLSFEFDLWRSRWRDRIQWAWSALQGD